MKWILILLIGLCAGCVSLDQLAPPVDTTWSGEQQEVAVLTRGRQLYITRCAKCHAVEPVRFHSQENWAQTLPKMVVEAKLTDQEQTDVRAYIKAVLARAANES